MTKGTSSFAVFIIGTGRSGTSLTTQALDKLGLDDARRSGAP